MRFSCPARLFSAACEVRMRAIVIFCLIPVAAAAQDSNSGRALFETRCANCHGSDGNGGAFGPAIVSRLAARNDSDLASFLRTGAPRRGMPPFDLPDTEMRGLVAHLRTLRPIRSGTRAPAPMKFDTTEGGQIDGILLSAGIDDLQVRSADGRVHLLRRDGSRFRPVTTQTDWPSYDGGQ